MMGDWLTNGLNQFDQFRQNFTNFAQQFQQQSTISPQQKVQELLNTGQMSQQQFNQLRDIANRITGKNY